jgi:glycerophosphoryl diester phosphodiesterase
VKYVKDCITMVKELDGHEITIVPATVGKIIPDASPEEEWKWAVDGMAEIMAHSLVEGVRPCIEPLNRHRGILLSAYLDDPVAAMRGVGATVLWQEWQQVDQDLVARVHEAGCSIIAWTVNEIGDLEHMARLGVDGLCGNYPDRIRVAIAARVEAVSRT